MVWGEGKELEHAGVSLRFLTPARLKYQDDFLTKPPPFHVLVRTLLRRVSSLSLFHGGHRWEIDYRAGLRRPKRWKSLWSHGMAGPQTIFDVPETGDEPGRGDGVNDVSGRDCSLSAPVTVGTVDRRGEGSRLWQWALRDRGRRAIHLSVQNVFDVIQAEDALVLAQMTPGVEIADVPARLI